MGGIQVTPIFPKKNKSATRVIVSGIRDSNKSIQFNDGLILNDSKGQTTKRVENILRNGDVLEC